MTINSSPGSLAFLSRTRINEKERKVEVADNLTKERIRDKYGQAIENKLDGEVDYIINPQLRSKKLLIDFNNL